jgi:tetratricopeptide (TPR) repeat protein
MIVLCWSPALLWADEQTEKAEVAYAQGIIEYDKGNYPEALEHFRTAAALRPEDANTQFYLGLSLNRVGEFPVAIVALEGALQLDATLQYVHYPLGLAYLQVDRYADALTQFQRAEQFDPHHALTRFYQGYTLYLLKQYPQAPEPLGQAMTLDQTLRPPASYYQGLSFYELERDREAREAFLVTRETAPQSLLGRSARSYLDALRARAREHQLFQVYGSASFQYDDNVILEPNDEALAFGDQGDGRFVFAMDARLVPVRTPRWRLGASYQFFQSVHFTLDEFDLRTHAVGLFSRLKLDRVTLNLATNYEFALLDNERFSHTFTLQPSATVREADDFFAVLSVRYNLDNFFDEVQPGQDPEVRSRDGWRVRLGADQYMTFNRKRSYVRLGYHYEVQRNDGTDWAYDGHNINVALLTPLWAGIALYAEGNYSRRDYLHTNSFDRNPLGILTAADRDARADDRLTGAITVQREFGPYVILSAGYVHVSNLSNVSFFDYRRNIVTLTLTGRY